uniref:F-box domain-containing protein n=1 Tax=Davidia involucrata TaxID=16924 RepID=A0A5B6YUY8_DAVIN
MSSRDLPIEIVIDILWRLPVKTLIRFRSVCKSWRSIISDSSFITTHFNNNNSSDADLLCMWRENGFKTTCTLVCSKTLDKLSEVELPLPGCKSGDCGCHIVGSCNGLLCLYVEIFDPFDTNIYLWNPSVRKLKTLPSSLHPEEFIKPETYVVLGFGFDHRTRDFKVVRILYNQQPLVEVYTLSTDSWRSIEVAVPFIFIYSSPDVPFVCRSFHWPAYSSGDVFRQLIVSFDISEEAFGEIMLPNYQVDGDKLHESIKVYKGLLALFVWSTHCCHVWVMKEYGVPESWMKQLTIFSQTSVSRSLGFTKDNEVILEGKEKELVAYDFENQNFRKIDIQNPFACNLVTFLESLFLLEGENEVFGQ